MDFSDYRPRPDVLARLRRVSLVAVVGPTAVGKSTLIAAAMRREPSIHLVRNNTSRAPRPGEQDGADYAFRTREDMLAGIARGDFVQVAPSVFGDIYATAPDGYTADGVAAMAVLADAMPTFRALPFKHVASVFVLPPDFRSWQARMHGFTPEQLTRRLAEAERSLQFALGESQTRFVINGDLERATGDFISLALGRPLNARQQADQLAARSLTQELLDQVRGLARKLT